jgi:hypothetical protein
MEETYLTQIIQNEIAGKNAAIHAYDKMMWSVRSGYLTLVFGGWGFVIKAAIESKSALSDIKPYILVLSAFTLILAIGAYLIDRNYARRKFRIIHAVNDLIQLLLSTDPEHLDEKKKKLTPLLRISGDADNKSYRFNAFYNEMKVSNIIYMLSSGLVILVGIYFLNQ